MRGLGVERWGLMERLWYLAHVAASFIAAKLSFRLIHPDRVGGLDHKSQIAIHAFTAFFVIQGLLAVLLLFVLKRTKWGPNAVLTGISLVWAGLMFGAMEIAGTTL
jgi:hypothetical protein